jgi:hypothetical protein
MIQRIQSVYLIVTTFLSVLFLKGSFLTFFKESGTILILTFNGLYRITNGQQEQIAISLIPLSVLLILIIITSIFSFLFFKKRKIQLRFTKSLIYLIILFIIISSIYSLIVITRYGVNILPTIKMFIPFGMLVFSILANRGIKKDDDLVKSYDRLR